MSSTEPLPIDVFFRGERYYIQGSLIISESVKVAEAKLHSKLAPGKIFLSEVGFKSFLDTGAGLIFASDASQRQKDAAIGYADFSTFGKRKKKERVLFLADTDATASRLQDSPKVISKFETLGSMSFGCDFTPTPQDLIDGFFRSVIEITKKSHALAFPGCSDILFIGLRKWAFPIFDSVGLNLAGKHTIKIGSCISKNGRGMTVSRLTTTLDSGEVFEGAITFSFSQASREI